MRFVFVDDAGSSMRDPQIVVAAIIVEAEAQLTRLDRRMTRLLQKHTPDEDPSSFFFDARDILSGSGHFGDHEKWPVERRMAILDELATIPTEMEIPILFGVADRRKHQWMDLAENTEMDVMSMALHAMAFISCAFAVERTMRSAYRDEIARLVAQDTDDARLLIRHVHDWYHNPIALERLGPGRALLPLTHIQTEVQFAEKAASSPLQLASFCAFLIRGKFIGNEQLDELYRKIAPVLIADSGHEVAAPRLLGLAQETKSRLLDNDPFIERNSKRYSCWFRHSNDPHPPTSFLQALSKFDQAAPKPGSHCVERHVVTLCKLGVGHALLNMRP